MCEREGCEGPNLGQCACCMHTACALASCKVLPLLLQPWLKGHAGLPCAVCLLHSQGQGQRAGALNLCALHTNACS